MKFRPKSSYQNGVAGFTLVEVAVILAIVSILAFFVASDVTNWRPDMRLSGAARDLYGAITKTKTEAMKRNTNCVLAFNQVYDPGDGLGARPFAYVIFEDNFFTNRFDANFDPPNDLIFDQVEQWPQDVVLDPSQGGGSGFTLPASQQGYPAISFSPKTIPNPVNGNMPGGSIYLISRSGKTKEISVNSAGGLRIN